MKHTLTKKKKKLQQAQVEKVIYKHILNGFCIMEYRGNIALSIVTNYFLFIQYNVACCNYNLKNSII
jgi:hypothetical protein